jgi:amino acid adenylation domain-containing protein
VAYTFLVDGDIAEASLTYGELDRQARTIGALLQNAGASGERALLLYPPGLEFIAAFFGCLYGGVVPIPAYPPSPAQLTRTLPKLRAIANDAQPLVALTTSSILSVSKVLLAQTQDFQALRWMATDHVDGNLGDAWWDPVLSSDAIAFLQYTSGSTAAPRGVMVSHANVLHNSALIHRCFQLTPASRAVSWLPPYHDMGLIGGVLQPLYGGFPITLLSPVAFLQRPLRWLEAISRTAATTSGGPNFAYDLCVRKSSPEQRATLDLSSWQVAFNGAEPVRPETLNRFVAAFEPCGFRREAFYPCYGLAEATLIVSGGLKTVPPVVGVFQGAALEHNQVVAASSDDAGAQTLVSCGQTPQDEKIVIADPVSCTVCPQDQVGEIWVAGPSTAQGYWNQPEATEHTFRAYLADTGEGPLLRTGDLGFLQDGELFVTGRLKDLIIIRGRNHYPQDIEKTVEQSHPVLRLGCGAAFSVDAVVDGEERLLIVQEVERHAQNPDVETVAGAIRQAVADHHELQVYAVVLIKTGSIPKTSSGKIQRHACRAGFLAGSLEVVGSSLLDDSSPMGNEEGLSRDALLALAREERQSRLESSLQAQVARLLRVLPSRLDRRQPLSTLGLDSLMSIELKNDLEAHLGVIVPIASFFEAGGITQLATEVLSQLSAPASTAEIIVAPAQAASEEHSLSLGQQALWFLHQLAPESAAYNIASAVRVRADVKIPALRRAFQRLLDRHPSLRTTFTASHGKPRQRVHADVEICLQEEDASAWSETSLGERLVQEAHHPFALERGPLLRVHVFTRSVQEHIILLTVHHIVADLWSLAVLIHELGILYQTETASAPAPLAMVALPYTDYVRRQAAMVSSPEGERLWTYWQKQLGGEVPALNLPTDRPRPPVQTYRGASFSFRLNEERTQQLKALAKAQGVTPYMTLLAAFQVLLSRYTGQDQILVGSPTVGRNSPELSGMVGYFVNPVVLRADLSGDLTFEAFLRQVRQTVLDALEHQDYPFSLLVERLQPVRDPSRSPLFQVMFALQQAPFLAHEGLTAFALGETGAQMNLGGLSVESMALDQRVAQFDLSLLMAEVDRGLAASLEYNTDLFDAATIKQMAGHFQTLLEGIIADPAQRLSALPLLTEVERHQVLVEWNKTQADYPGDVCIHRLFEAQVEQTPEAIAVGFHDQQVTYEELSRRANKLAHYLRALGVAPEVRVGIYMEHSLARVVGLLGILKADAAYVPLDPAYPPERLAFMLADAHVSVLLTQEELAGRLPALIASAPPDAGLHRPRTLCLDTDWPLIAQEPAEPLVSRATAANLAYVIYTSGSTGKPKGVEISHAGVVNLITWHQRVYGVTPADRATQIAAPAFDAAVWELWPYLTAGASIHIPAEPIRSSPRQLLDWLGAEAITISFLPTPLAEAIIEEQWPPDVALRALLTGGDQLHPIRKALPFALFNHYGPTEYSVVTTWTPVVTGTETDASPPIGRPIANTQVFLLDPALHPVPIGVAGELYIGGVGLARSYLKRPELTAERFIPHPFSEATGARLYRTGDLARYLPDGRLEFLGRTDHQVKIRGFRIELGEIEALLRQHPAVQESVVLAREDIPGDKRLVAYVVARPGQNPAPGDLRRFLQGKLPEYMVPAAVRLLAALPLTANGKVDRRTLPRPEQSRPDLEGACVAPRTRVEAVLADIWAEVLGLDRIGIDDNFFELGGHSLLATQVMHRVHDVLQVTPPLHSLFEEPTIARLASVIEQHEAERNGDDLRGIQARPRQQKSTDQLLAMLAQLSEDETKGILQERNAVTQGRYAS